MTMVCFFTEVSWGDHGLCFFTGVSWGDYGLCFFIEVSWGDYMAFVSSQRFLGVTMAVFLHRGFSS